MMTAGIVDQSAEERACKSKEREGLEDVSGRTRSGKREESRERVGKFG